MSECSLQHACRPYAVDLHIPGGLVKRAEGRCLASQVADRVQWAAIEREKGPVDIRGNAHVPFDEDRSGRNALASTVAQVV